MVIRRGFFAALGVHTLTPRIAQGDIALHICLADALASCGPRANRQVADACISVAGGGRVGQGWGDAIRTNQAHFRCCRSAQ